ncbi:MAG: ABC transporter permease [Ruminococcus sp.]|nr:ABC transporter permease [Ruminococcus sp.]
MQVFKLFLKILKKRLAPALLFTGIFILILASISASSSQSETYEPSELRLAIFDEDNTEASKLAIKYISKGNEIIKIDNDDDKLLDALYYTTIHYSITVNKGFEEKLSRGETDDLFTVKFVHENYSNALADSKMNEYVKTVSAYIKIGQDIETASKSAADTLSKHTKVTYQQDTKSADEIMAMFFQYLPYVLFSAIISALGPVLIVMERKEVKDRTHCSSLKPSNETLGKLLGAAVFVAADWAVFMIAGTVISGNSYAGKALYAVANSVIYALISAGIALLVATLVSNDNVLNVIIQVFGLGSSFLCGVFVPQEFLGSRVLTAAKVLPAYWYIKANNSIFSMSDVVFSKTEILKCFCIEGIFAVIVFAAAFTAVKMSRRSKKM